MAVTRWRPVEDYHPAVRLMVRYMWRQEPPLLPSGFADRMGLPRQVVSRWLQVPAPADGSDAAAVLLPSLTPPLAVRLARAMGLSPHAFLLAAGLCTDEEPLFAVEDVWEHVLACIAATKGGDGDPAMDDVRRILVEARDADLCHVANSEADAASAAYGASDSSRGMIGVGVEEASAVHVEQS